MVHVDPARHEVLALLPGRTGDVLAQSAREPGGSVLAPRCPWSCSVIEVDMSGDGVLQIFLGNIIVIVIVVIGFCL